MFLDSSLCLQLRPRCSTNSYGPSDSSLSFCSGKCHQNLTEDGLDNPSLANSYCRQFRDQKLTEALRIHSEQMGGEEEHQFLGWVRIHYPGGEVTCYPHHREVLEEARSHWDTPYRHGWCPVCRRGENCRPGPDSGWGWCQAHCQDQDHQILTETAVEAFVYENCSSSVNVMTEFCSSVPTVSGYGQVWSHRDGRFVMTGHEKRKYHLETSRDNRHNTLPNPCFGTAGGSVWKFFKFSSGGGGERGEPLAVLTGVISRYRH